MNFKRNKSYGSPAYRTNSSDWRYPRIEHGNSARGNASSGVFFFRLLDGL